MASMIYLDNNATTRMDDRVLEVMLPYFTEIYGNPSSTIHLKGLEAQRGVDTARSQVAQLINCDPQEVIFTSGSTESLNHALKGLFEIYKSKGNHFIIGATEHMAVIETCNHLEKLGAHITVLPVNEYGLIDIDELESVITDKTIGVCLMLVNNETGVMQPIQQISSVIHKKNAMLVCDATQAPGKLKIDTQQLGADILCISGHKMYGPKGVGALYIRRKNPRVTLSPLLDGGGQERGLRSGTYNVPGIVGLGKACELMMDCKMETVRLELMRNTFEKALLLTKKAKVNGSIPFRACNVSNIQLKGVTAKNLFQKLPLISFSTGSACSTGKSNHSHVLSAMGLSEQEIESSIRVSFGRFNTLEEANEASKKLIEIIS